MGHQLSHAGDCTGATPVVFGDLSKWCICDFSGEVQVLKEVRAEFAEDVLQLNLWTSGVLVDAGTHPVAALTMHS